MPTWSSKLSSPPNSLTTATVLSKIKSNSNVTLILQPDLVQFSDTHAPSSHHPLRKHVTPLALLTTHHLKVSGTPIKARLSWLQQTKEIRRNSRGSRKYLEKRRRNLSLRVRREKHSGEVSSCYLILIWIYIYLFLMHHDREQLETVEAEENGT